MHDERYLEASYDDMQLDYYAAYHAAMRASGRTVETFEDDAFDLNDILQKLEDEAEDVPDDWETVETWDARDEPENPLGH